MRAFAIVRRIAATQLGVVTRRQLHAAGLSNGAIDRLVAAGLLERVHRGVYVVASATRSHEQRVIAACLACGTDAAASFGTAASILRIGPAPDEVHVTVPHGRRPRTTTIQVHRTTVWRPRDVTRRGPVVVTSPARTLADLSGCSSRTELTLLTDETLRRRLIHASALLRYLEDPSVMAFDGTGVLRSIVRDRLAHGLPDSGFEAKMIELLEERGLPRPKRQYRTLASGRRVRFDLAYPEHGFVIELDGWDPHSARVQWQTDHDRRNAIELAGWGQLAFTWEDVNHRRGYVAATVGERLGLLPIRWTTARSARRRRSGREREERA